MRLITPLYIGGVKKTWS